MADKVELKIGDIIKRVGMDIRLRCTGCNHQVMLPRKQVEKGFRGFA